MNDGQILAAVEELQQAFSQITHAKQALEANGIETLSYTVNDTFEVLEFHVYSGLEELWAYFGPDIEERQTKYYTEKRFTAEHVRFFAIADSKGNYRKANT